MNEELKNAVRNVDFICKNARLTRDEHDALVKNVAMIYEALEKKVLKKEAKDGKS